LLAFFSPGIVTLWLDWHNVTGKWRSRQRIVTVLLGLAMIKNPSEGRKAYETQWQTGG
jgi:uncharacterized iron-regulated membrane protein